MRSEMRPAFHSIQTADQGGKGRANPQASPKTFDIGAPRHGVRTSAFLYGVYVDMG